ncbi:hypothetical protein HHI36_005148 [Cryptolaemus montrouzieri]|uniref:Uncharacterized protein n=1 Tax=Cryptolaemus montrouzieri TaxID=559131 RepID=A0ABD2NUT6_9CUCU
MSIATWNVQGIRLKTVIIAKELETLSLDIVHTPVYPNTKEQPSLLVKNNLKQKISNWKVNSKLQGQNVTFVVSYAPSDYEEVGTKQEFYEELKEILTGIGQNREISA